MKINQTELLRWITLVIVLAALLCRAPAADAPSDPARDREMRDRYETVLLKNPFQERAFNQVYEGYSKVEGVDKWIEALKPKVESEDGLAALLLLGQVYDRQFKTADAIAALEKAAAKGESRPQFKVLLGTLSYKAGRDEKATELLGAALDSLTDLDQRSSVCRMLGNLYLRQGKRDQAIAVWKRISEQNPTEVFAQLELAEIYEDNRMWTNAITVYRQIADLAQEDPYRRCRALRSIGQALVQSEKFKEAIATYEQALELVSPGNWLFEDLKLRLVGVYDDIGDLAGLVKYVNAKLEQNPGDIEFRDLLAEAYSRMAKFDDAEKEYRAILERNPRNSSIYERLLSLYTRVGRKADVVATFEKLLELFPTDTDYLRRLGEFHLRDTNPDKAKEAWRRLTKDLPTAEKLAQLAGWFESYEFPDEAITAYQQALEKGKNKDWTLRLAALKFGKGDEAEAIKLWLSVIDPATSKLEDYAEVASLLESNQKLDEAVKLRKTAVEKDPANLDSRLAYAKTLMRQKKHEEAVAEFDILADQDENEFMMQQGEAGRLDAWRELGILEEKQTELEKALTANPQDAKLLNRVARLYERGGQRDKAIQLYEKRREGEPDNVEHLRNLATLYKASKQTEQAIEVLKTLLEKDKNRARVYQKDLLEVYLAVDLKDEAIAAGEQTVSLAPTDPEARLMLAQVYQLYRQHEKAFAEYRHALRLEPNEPDYYRQYGEALEAEKCFGEAQEALRKMLDAAKEDTTRLSAVGNLARIYLQQNQLNDLVAEFSRRIRNTPKKLAAYEELAGIYKESGQLSKSVEVLESGLQNVDEKSAALKALIRVGYEAQDFAKVKSYFEQLLALSGKPTAQEFEKLGQIYAQLGDIEKAKETWNKMVSDSRKDPKAHDRLAQVLRDQGFTDEGLMVKAQAVELDPNDYRRRFEYAQFLAQNQQPVEAMKQLALILEIGDRQEKKEDEKAAEKKVQRVTKGQQGQPTISPYQFVYGLRSSGRGYYGGSWQGTYGQFRPQVLMLMASVAQQSIGEDAFLDQLREKATKAKENIDAKRDLLTILQMYNRVEDALKLALEILERVPNDVDLLQQTALYYSSQQQIAKAIPLLKQLAQSQPKYRLQAYQGLIPLYFQNKQEEKALELTDNLLKENPTDMQVIWAMGSLMQNHGKFDRAKAIYRKGLEIDPQMKQNVTSSLANLARQENNLEEANRLYTELLLSEPPRYAWLGSRRQQNVYVPTVGPNQGPRYGGPMGNIPQNVFGYIDYSKSEALRQLKLAQKPDAPGTNVFDQLEATARGYQNAVSALERNKAWDTARLLCAWWISEKQNDKAVELLKALREAGVDEMDWFNISMYLAQLKDDYDGMLKLYDEVQQRFPAKTRDIAEARAITYTMAKRYDDTAKVIRDMNQQRVPPAKILGMINALRQAGEKKLARTLLEEHLSGVSRNSEALAALASLCGEDSDYDQAIALASEAWERKAHGRQSQAYMYGGPYYYGGYYGGGYYGGYPGGDNLLNELHRYHVAAGKSEELINKFKERLEKQPSSVQAHENLAQLHRLSQNREAALEVYQKLTEKRPHLHQTKRQVASIYSEMGDFKQATQVYEDLMKANPNLYQQFAWELRYLYQRMGKGKELAQMEEKMADKARQPHEIRNMAYQFQNDGEYDKAIEMLRKAMKMSPGDSYMKNQLAQLLVQQGQLDEAVALYQEWLDSPQVRGQGWIDHHTLRSLVGFYRATGRLQQLKDRCDSELKKNPNDRISQGMQAHIGIIEKRFDDAVAGLQALMQAQRDPNGMWQLMELSDITGDLKPVFEAVEKADPNNLDYNRVAQLYMAKGDARKAEDMIVKYAEQQMGWGNSGMLPHVVEQFSQLGLWEAAETFIKKHRNSNLQQWEAQEFDRVIADQYINKQRFTAIIDEVLKRDSFKGRDLDLVKMIAQQYQQGSQPSKRRAFLEKICASDPKNRELAFQLSELYDVQTDGEKKLAVLKRLVDDEPANLQYREALTRSLIALGRADEAIESFRKWAEEKPLEVRWSALSRAQAAAARWSDARASLVKAYEVCDPSRKPDVKAQLAQFDAQHGDPLAEKQALRENFEAKKDANAFNSYFSLLQNQGLTREAYEFFLASKDAGYLEQYRGDEVLQVCMNESDFKAPLDLNWRFTRYGERWNRDQFLSRVAQLFVARGKYPLLLADLQTRINAETNQNPVMLEKLAQALQGGGFPEKALAIYDQLVQRSPFNRAALNAKAQLLVTLKREEEAIALLRDAKGIQGLQEEVDAKFQLAELLFKAKRDAEAEKELTDLRSWAKSGNVAERVAGIYHRQKNYARAAELYEESRSRVRSWNYDNLLFSLGQCYAKLGRADDAIKTWTSGGGSRYGGYDNNRVRDWLIGEGLYEIAIKFAEQLVQKNPEDLNSYVALARAQAGLAKTNEAFATCERASNALTRDQQTELRQRLADLVVERDLADAALARRENADSPVLTGALIHVLARAGTESPAARLVAERASRFAVVEPGLQVQLADALIRMQRTNDATVWYRKGLGATNQVQRVAAARGLALAGRGSDAVPVLKDLLRNKPQDFLTDTTLISAAAKAGDANLNAELRGLLNNAALHEAEKEYYAVFLDYHSGKTTEVRGRLMALAAAPKLSTAQLQSLATICDEQKMPTERVKVLERLAAGGYGNSARTQALSDLVKLNAQAGNLKQAVATLAQMNAAWAGSLGEETCEAIASAVNAANYPACREAVIQAVQQAPDHDRVSNLLGLCQQIAQRLDKSDSAARLATDANAAASERDEAAAWDSLIEKWEIAGPYRFQNQEMAFPPEREYLSKPGDRTIAEKIEWKPTDPKRVLGIVRVGSVLGVCTNEVSQQVAYARTTIDSAEDRRVTFAFGCDDWADVWVNGELVHNGSNRPNVFTTQGVYMHQVGNQPPPSRYCALDQDRFTVSLKKGANKVLVKIGNHTDAWSYCLRIVEAKESSMLARQ